MSFIDAKNGKPAEGKPVRVVTEVRKVRYEYDHKTSEGVEIAKEVLTTSDHAWAYGEPKVQKDVKVVDLRTPEQTERRDRRQFDQFADYDQESKQKNQSSD